MIIKNATLISMSENREKIEYNIDILVKDNKISKIGKDLDTKNVDKVIEADGKVVLPGLINSHSHVPMSIFRETADGYNLQDWLTKKMWPMEDKIIEADIYYTSYLSFIEMIKTGSTTINDMYAFADEIIRAQKETEIRLQTSRALMNIAGDEDGESRLKELKELVDKYNDKDKMTTLNAGIHGLYTSSESYMKKCVNFARENKIPIHIHFCENSKELEDIKNSYNKEPIDVLANDFQDIHTILAHCVKLSKEDIEKIKDMNIHVAHCPVSNLKLGCGIAPVYDMIKSGINVSIGTDSQGSGCNLDMFEQMKFTGLLQKGINENAELMLAYEILKMATINGAKALGLDKEIGSIDIGKQADIIIVNLDNTLMKPQNDLISEIVYNAKGTDVETTIVDGNILMENKKLKETIKEKEIYDKCEEIIDRISK